MTKAQKICAYNYFYFFEGEVLEFHLEFNSGILDSYVYPILHCYEFKKNDSERTYLLQPNHGKLSKGSPKQSKTSLTIW